MAEFYSTIQSAHFQTQTRYYANKAAIDVKAENPLAEHHEERAAFARSILFGSAPFYEMSLSIGANATIRSKIEADQDYDSDLAFVMASIYNAYAVSD